MNASLPEILRADPRNRALLAYLERAQPSAHSDLVEELERALDTVVPSLSGRGSGRGLSRYELFCPDPSRYAYVLAYVESGAAFALASGMQAIALRLPAEQVTSALAEGAQPSPDLGTDWLRFEMFGGDMAAARAPCALGLAGGALRLEEAAGLHDVVAW